MGDDLRPFFQLKPGIETEIRFGKFNRNQFQADVGPDAFKRILAYFGELDELYDKVQLSTDEQIYTTPQGNSMKEIFTDDQDLPHFQSKETLWTKNFPDQGYRIASAKETSFQPKSPFDVDVFRTQWNLFHPHTFRSKNRTSFTIPQGIQHVFTPFRIDLTEVEGWTFKNQIRVEFHTYEVELEQIRALTDLDPQQAIQQVLSNLYGTHQVATIPDVIDGFNHLFGKTNRVFVNPPLNKPVDLRRFNLDTLYQYFVTDKADGERKLLYVYQGQGYLLREYTNHLIEYPTVLPNDSVLDGEYISSTHSFMAFDILFLAGKDVRSEPFRKRWERLQGLEIPQKVFLPPSENLFKRTSSILNAISSKKYGNDGLIFNHPDDDYFRPHTVLKWKPEHLLTIDFKVKGNTLYLLHEPKKGWLPAYATYKYLALPVLLDFLHFPPLTLTNPGGVNYQEDDIVEFTMDRTQSTISPFRIRKDRQEPNGLTTVSNLFKVLMDPIEESTIRGTDLVVMRRYHNKVKASLLPQRTTILDIGSGRGGDVMKWVERELNVFCVEPNGEHILELKRRLVGSGYQPTAGIGDNIYTHAHSRVVILQGYGQEADRIVTEFRKHFSTCDAMYCMNSLTFFFDKETSLSALKQIQTELRIGKLMGLVMDGDLVQKIRKEVKDDGWTLEKRETTNTPFGNTVYVHFQDTIVQEQTEYLFFFDVFVEQMKGTVDETYFLSDENLSPSQNRLSSFYRAFKISFPFSFYTVKYHPPTPLRKLYLEELVPLQISEERWIRIGVEEDDSLLHSFLRCLIPKYIDDTNHTLLTGLHFIPNDLSTKRRIGYQNFKRNIEGVLAKQDLEFEDSVDILRKFFKTRVIVYTVLGDRFASQTFGTEDKTVHLLLSQDVYYPLATMTETGLKTEF